MREVRTYSGSIREETRLDVPVWEVPGWKASKGNTSVEVSAREDWTCCV